MRKYFLLIILLLSIFCTASFSQKGIDKEYVFKIDNHITSFYEFKKSFQKANTDDKSKISSNDFLDLYINYKLKVIAAKDSGLDTLRGFKNEISKYRGNLVNKYLLDREVTEALLKEAYQRLKEEVSVSHILIKLNDIDGNPRDTLLAFNKLLKIRNRIVNKGENFDKLAETLSEDPSAKNNLGNLGYFTVFKMVYPFESQSYKTAVGKVSPVFRTPFGYHIIKVNGRRASHGRIKVAHILIRKNSKDKSDTLPKSKVYEIYSKLKSGKNTFAQLAKQFSEDPNTARLGGELNFYSAGDLEPKFYEEIARLKKDNEYTKPFETSYGYHIAKRIEVKPIESFEKTKSFLEKKVAKDSRTLVSINSMVKKLKKEYKFKTYPKAIQQVDKLIGKDYYTKPINLSDYKEKDYAKPVCEYIPFSHTSPVKLYQKDLIRYYYAQQPLGAKKKIPLEVFKQDLKNKFFNNNILLEESKILDKKHKDLALLLGEYEGGLLLYEIMNKEVWGKSIKDSLALDKFFKQNKEKYKWTERVDFSVYNCLSESMAKKLKSTLLKKNKLTDSALYLKYNKESQLNLSFIKHKKLPLKSFKNTYKVDKPEPKKFLVKKQEGRYNLIYIKKILAPSYKKLSESRGKIISDYQNYLEKNWLENLKKNKKIVVNRKILEKL